MSSRHQIPAYSYNMLRRERASRGRLDPAIDTYGVPLQGYLNNFLFDPYTGRPIEDRIVDVDELDFGGPDRFQSFASRGRSGGRNQNYYSIRQDLIDDQIIPRSRTRMSGPAKGCKPIAQAMKELHKQIGKAETFYRDFQSEFDSDTSSLKNYANQELFKQLWVSKIVGKMDPLMREGEDDDPYSNSREEDDDEKEYQKKFGDMRRDMTAALKAAVASTMKGNVRNLEKAERLLDKVETAHRQIEPLLEAASKEKRHCKDLLVELDQLKNLVNPEADNNKDWLKGGESDGGIDNEGAGNRSAWVG